MGDKLFGEVHKKRVPEFMPEYECDHSHICITKKKTKKTPAMGFSSEPLSPRSSECSPTDMKETYVSDFKGNADGVSKSPIGDEKGARGLFECAI